MFATDSSGTKVWEASYLPFGGVQTSTGPNSDLRFPGQWFQSETGLHQNWMRDYDPTTGRYIQADPLGLVDGASVYGYALQNPGRYIDPRGEQSYYPSIPSGTGWFNGLQPLSEATIGFGQQLGNGYQSYYRGLGRCAAGYCSGRAGDAAMQRIIQRILNDPDLQACILKYLSENPAHTLGRFGAGSLNTFGSSLVLGPIGTGAGFLAGLGAVRGDVQYYDEQARRQQRLMSDEEIANAILFGEQRLENYCDCGDDPR